MPEVSIYGIAKTYQTDLNELQRIQDVRNSTSNKLER